MKSLKELRRKYTIAKLIKKIDDRYGFQALVRKFYIHWFNPFATIYINFFSFPFKQAIKLPMFVYGRPKLYRVVGDMRIIGKVNMGMIKFNATGCLNSSHEASNSEFSNLGTILFYGSVKIGCGNRILVQKGATLELCNSVVIMDCINLGCHYHVFIGENTKIAHRSQIQESNHHFIFENSTRTIKPCTKPIRIGKCCWICNSTTITSGAIIPDYCIIASNSLVNAKKEIANAPCGAIIGGIPAKVLSTEGRYKINNGKWESMLFQWFANYPTGVYNVPENVSLEELINQ